MESDVIGLELGAVLAALARAGEPGKIGRDRSEPMPRYASFSEFYPFYLSEHAKPATRRLHFIGSSISLICLVLLVLTGDLWWLLAGLFSGYGFAWFAHLAVEKNRPATFQQPLYSFMSDWKMFWQILTGQIRF
jgi:hypothetical protein